MFTKLFKKSYNSIPYSALIYMSWRNLIAKKLRSSLTIIGIMIGVGAIFFLLSLGLGLQRLVSEEVIGNSSIKTIDAVSPNSKIIQLDDETSRRISELGHVSKVSNIVSSPGSIAYNGSEVDTVAYGIDSNYQQVTNLSLVKGRSLTDEDGRTAIINKVVLESIGLKDPEKAIGQKIDILLPIKSIENKVEKNQLRDAFTIVGVMDSGEGKEIFIPVGTFNQAEDRILSQVKVLADDTANVGNLRKQIESMGFQTTSPMDTIEQINQIFKYFNLILVGFGAIGMVVAVLGMFNTLTISLLERTREIGLMFALGARHKDMRILFFIEAILLSLIGSVLGISFAVIGGKAVNLAMMNMAKNRGVVDRFDIFSTPWWLVLSLILFMVFVGVFVVIMPARRAEKINPIDALRRE